MENEDTSRREGERSSVCLSCCPLSLSLLPLVFSANDGPMRRLHRSHTLPCTRVCFSARANRLSFLLSPTSGYVLEEARGKAGTWLLRGIYIMRAVD